MNDISLPGLISSDDLSRLNTHDTIVQIKTAVIRQFQGLDARMRIHNTQYFNHSFVPDLVLRWSRGSPGERYVYIRSSSQDEVLVDDVARFGDLKPIVLGLVPIQSETEQKTLESLDRLAYEKDTLVTDLIALTEIGEAKRDRPVTSLFSTALVRGGRGLLGGDDARKATDLIADGFNGAQQIETDLVSRATATAEDHLSAPFANRFNRLLQALWIASGGRTNLFPDSQTKPSASVDDDALNYLLEQESYDVESGLERLVTWMSDDAPSSARQPRQRGRQKKTSASSAHGYRAQSEPGASETPLSDVRFLTLAEVALVMRVSKMTVYRLVHSGELEAIRVGRSFRVPEAAINQYLRAAFVGTD